MRDSSCLFCHVILPRTGLGNRLLPWARCRLFAEVNHARMLVPYWPQVKFMSSVRGALGHPVNIFPIRTYHNLFRRGREEVTGWQRLWLQWTASKCPEPSAVAAPWPTPVAQRTVVVFEGLRDYFQQLKGWDEFLHRELRAITRTRWLRRVDQIPLNVVGINVGLSPFGDRVPPWGIEWYAESLALIRKIAGFSVPAFLVSDGRPRVLAPLLTMGSVTLVTTGSAIGDILLLARARVLIGSGGSTFSAWAAFLGQMPTVTPPGYPLSWFRLHPRRRVYWGTLDPTSPSPIFVEQAREIVNSAQGPTV